MNDYADTTLKQQKHLSFLRSFGRTEEILVVFSIFSDIGSLTRIKDQLPAYIGFNHIKVVIATLVSRFGLTTSRLGSQVLNVDASSLKADKPVLANPECMLSTLSYDSKRPSVVSAFFIKS